MQKLKVKGVSGRLCTDPAALNANFIRFVGQELKGDEWSPVECEVAFSVDIVRALKKGDLLPADDATAQAAGVALPKRAPQWGKKADE